LWNEVERFVEKRNGWLILDDTVLDKIYSEQIELTYYQWSGKHHKIVKGIGLITLVWTDGVNTFPVDYRIYDKDGDELSKNDHFRDMVKTAFDRGFQPYFVMFDSWYSGIDNLKCIDTFGWYWFSRIKKNRMVNPDKTGNRPVSVLTIPDDGMTVHMKKYGFVRVFLQAICWSIENYHRALKDLCCVEKCKIRKEAGQRNHINCSLRAFIRLEVGNQINDITIYNAKWDIVKPAIARYLLNPKYAL